MAEIPPYIRLFCEGSKTEPNYFIPYFKAKGFHQPNMLNPKTMTPKAWQKPLKRRITMQKKC